MCLGLVSGYENMEDRLNPRDKSILPRHTGIIGTTGGGKSTTVATLIHRAQAAGIATIVFGLSTIFLLSLAALFVAGCADMVSVFIRQSLIQLHTPDEMRGRVSAVSQLTISASNELGEAESGLVASLFGPVGAVVFGGIAAIGITALWSRLFPELRLAKTFDPPEILQTPPQHGAAQP